LTRITQYFRRTLSARICLCVLLSVTVLLVAALSVMFRYSHNAIEQESLAKAEQMLNEKVQYIENHLHAVEVATRNMRWNVEQKLHEPDMMETYCSQMTRNNPNIVGCAIVFKPNYYKEKGELFLTYAYHPEDEDSDVVSMTHDPHIIQPDLFAETPYVGVNWYTIPMEENTTCWVRPHAPNDTINSTIVSCCMPIHDKKGNPVGVMAADVSVEWLSNMILSSHPFPNSYTTVLAGPGTYIIHRDSTFLYHKMMPKEMAKEPDPRVKELVRSILAGESGCRSVHVRGKDCYVLYKAMNNGHWNVCMVCPEDDIFAVSKRQQSYMFVIMLLSIVLIVAFCFFIVRGHLKPLELLSQSAQRISQGDYSIQIPSTRRKDEVGMLQNNFGEMHTSLSLNIQQMNDLSETLKERNEELGAIHAKVREADNLKMNFIHKIADKMIMPIKGIDGGVAHLEENCENITKEETQTLSEQMMSHAKAITDLLEQMLEIPKKKKNKTS